METFRWTGRFCSLPGVPCRRRPLPARVTCGLSPRVLPRACPWVQGQAMALFFWKGPVSSLHPLVLFLGATAASFAGWGLDPQALGDGRRGSLWCKARTTC